MDVTFRRHAVFRMFDEDISPEEVREALSHGETIEEYPDDKPYPSRLALGVVENRPIHVVAAYNSVGRETIVVTAYRPDPKRWEADWKTRRRKP